MKRRFLDLEVGEEFRRILNNNKRSISSYIKVSEDSAKSTITDKIHIIPEGLVEKVNVTYIYRKVYRKLKEIIKTKKVILSLVIILFYSLLGASTPYRSLDRNDYHEVVKALKKPEWLNSYCRYNFRYVSDKKQYGKEEWIISGRMMFQKRKGDCEDYAEFIYDVLKYHNYDPLLYGVYSRDEGHAIVIFKYGGDWNLMDNEGLRQNFSSKSEVLNYTYDKKNLSSVNITQTDIIDEDTYYSRSPLYMSSGRLILHSHLTKADSGVHFFIPTLGGKTYISSLHKEAVGILVEIDSFYFSGIGASISGHGFYANSFLESEKMYTSHFLFLNSRIGVSYYFGDFNGIDVDLKIFNSSRYELYFCCRNFGEVFDMEFNINIIKNSLRIVSEKIDKEYIIGTELFLIGNTETENVRYSIRNIDTGLTITIPFAEFSFKYNFKQKDLASISGTIKF